ncbi:phage scaffolding protein [Clostridium botulinum]|uniref:Phage scaffold protein n=1 Tax=Clostridium botulinum (strain 657 / Type Ba4) TaxID=515621 RepID=A0A3F2ZXP2_CLOB6|nr:phage scaffolding protein [Clostridium botulinum]ACQ52329.1 phage scaffold protein [Clostridium botulinum Ba4 str. 657]APU61201.1 phage minor structural GP20 family protein [Clostridium botulinum]AXG90533.1 phage capsid protein [Clostridium botulinum]MBY6757007.1 phage scaffolding protein [Clostridium botulinum]RFM20601.1 phage capsid protein [Clostridium botulinum]
MANLKEIIGEELFKQLPVDKQKEYKDKDFEDISGGAFIPKTRFDQVNEQAKEYKKQVGERDTQLKSLKEQYKDVDGLKEKFEKLELDNKTQKETYEKQLNDIAFNNALEKGLGAFNIKDKNLIMALIDKDKLKIDGDNVIGLKEQIEPLKTSHEYLFDKEIKGTGSFGTGGNNDPEPNKTNFASELGKQRAENMKAKSLTDFAK